MKKFLCVCFGNSCRSPMMKTLLTKKLTEKGIEATVDSAGIAEKDPTPASDNARAVMKEHNLSLEGHTSKHVREVDLQSFDKILVVDQKTKEAVIAQGADADKVVILNEANDGVPNPYGGDIDVYRNCATSIDQLLDEFVETIA